MAYERCMRCGRKLKDPRSKETGLGGTCEKIVLGLCRSVKKSKKLPKGLIHNKLFDVEK